MPRRRDPFFAVCIDAFAEFFSPQITDGSSKIPLPRREGLTYFRNPGRGWITKPRVGEVRAYPGYVRPPKSQNPGRGSTNADGQKEI